MKEPLDEQYLNWLYSKVASVKQRTKVKTYWSLFRQMYNTEFLWFVANDDNRAEDGRDLRYEFLGDDTDDTDWLGLGCSVLELLIGLSRRLAFEAGGSARVWFWQLMENLDLDRYNDADYDQGAIEEKLDRLIWRKYNFDGTEGGLFPLKYPPINQKDAEIWYQLCAYILERQ